VALTNHRPQSAKIAFCVAIALCAAYYVSFQLWRWSEAPGYLILGGSLPWSWPWLEGLSMVVNRGFGWRVRNVLDVVVGFSLNIAIASLIVSIAWEKARSLRSPWQQS
jgi:hypothetical protein